MLWTWQLSSRRRWSCADPQGRLPAHWGPTACPNLTPVCCAAATFSVWHVMLSVAHANSLQSDG